MCVEEFTLKSIQNWIEKHLRLQLNPAKKWDGEDLGTQEFLGFQLTRLRRIKIAPDSVERFKAKVREISRRGRSLTEEQFRTLWQQYLRGWWQYYQLQRSSRTDLPTQSLGFADTSGSCSGCAGYWPCRTAAEPAISGVEGPPAEGGSQQQRGPGRQCALQLTHRPFPTRSCDAPVSFPIGSCGHSGPLSSTAGCGKPHVRWCGRVPGRNPRHSTRSRFPCLSCVRYTVVPT